MSINVEKQVVSNSCSTSADRLPFKALAPAGINQYSKSYDFNARELPQNYICKFLPLDSNLQSFGHRQFGINVY